MRKYLFLFLIVSSHVLNGKEWRNLRVYQKATHLDTLSPTDWLTSDRERNTLIWKRANKFNLTNNLPQEYVNVLEREYFYKWLYEDMSNKGHEIVWIRMAHFISDKLAKLESVPYALFCGNKILNHADIASEKIFNNAFSELSGLFVSNEILKGNEAKLWDENMLYLEQYIWVEPVYKSMNAKNLKKLKRIAKGQFLYGLVVPKIIRFKGDFLNAEARYNYALNILLPYCRDAHKE